MVQKLNNFTRAPEYIAYLAYILSAMTQEEDRIRTIAGYLLKNNSRLILSSSPEVAVYVRSAILQAFNDPSIMIRNAAGQDIVAFLGVLEPKNWPECLQQLVNTLDSTDFDRQEVSSSHVSFYFLNERGGISDVNDSRGSSGYRSSCISFADLVVRRPRLMFSRRPVKIFHVKWISNLTALAPLIS